MNWSKVMLSGFVAGLVGNLVDFALHGFVMADTYAAHPAVFSQEEGSPVYFFVISICFWIAAAILFGKTRSCWSDGAKGGATYGFYLGLTGFFVNFYHAMVIADWPYFLSWCWGGIGMITGIIGGAVLGAIYKRT